LTETFFINSTPNAISEKVQTFFHKYAKQRLAVLE